MNLKDKISKIPNKPIENDWFDYIQQLGLTEKDIPELIEILKDGDIEAIAGGVDEDYSPMHAWRSLAQLKALNSLDVMIDLVVEDFESRWLIIELEKIIPAMGFGAIEKVVSRLNELEENDRIDILNYLIKGLTELALVDPLSEETVTELFYNQLCEYRFNYDIYNAYLANGLVKLKSFKSIQLIENAIINYQYHLEDFDQESFDLLVEERNRIK